MRHTRSNVRASLCATLALVGAMFVGRLAWGTPFIPELIAEHIFALVTPRLFTLAIRLLGFGAKWVAFGLAVIGYIGGGVGLGWAYARLLRRASRPSSVGSGGLFGAAVWLALMLWGLPLLGVGVFGVRLRHGALPGALALLGGHLLYGGLLGWLTGSARPPVQDHRPDAADLSAGRRRALLRGIVRLPLLWPASIALGHLMLTVGARLAWAMGIIFEAIKGLSPEVTPNDKFYIISKNLFDPTLNPKTWKLTIHGLVEQPLQLSLDELKALPSYEAYVTFTCISNEIGGDLIGNAMWKGVSLQHLLALARVKPEARKVIFRADDGYSTGVPLERCLRPQTFLAYELNGKALPDKHGFPLRAVIPGYYGMKQPKWLTEIDVVAADYQGYWEQRGWADDAVVKTMSRIDVPPHRGEVPASGAVIAGIAFAGERGITQVEVSVDGGKTWHEAQLKPALSPYSWVLWARELAFPQDGEYPLAVRATDGQGNLQEDRLSEPLPDGASGYHKIRVKVQAT
jgi:DMSO/TMAO reductase YedYZ molybdopterin-dependent catalytic subunit